jgi:hypothetical protein
LRLEVDRLNIDELERRCEQAREGSDKISATFQSATTIITALYDLKNMAATVVCYGGISIPGRHGTGGRPNGMALDTLITKLVKLYRDATGERERFNCHRITRETTGRFVDFARIALLPLGENAPKPDALRKRVERLAKPRTQKSQKKSLLSM